MRVRVGVSMISKGNAIINNESALRSAVWWHMLYGKGLCSVVIQQGNSEQYAKNKSKSSK